jgi:hypothetical protein
VGRLVDAEPSQTIDHAAHDHTNRTTRHTHTDHVYMPISTRSCGPRAVSEMRRVASHRPLRCVAFRQSTARCDSTRLTAALEWRADNSSACERERDTQATGRSERGQRRRDATTTTTTLTRSKNEPIGRVSDSR